MDIFSVLEWVATLVGLANITLIAMRSVWNYLFGLINVSLYVIVFFHAKLYADTSLHIIYIFFQFYGWYQWMYGGEHHTKLAFTRVSLPTLLNLLGAITILSVLFMFILSRYTNSTMVPLDATTTAMSLVAQFMMSKKWLEHWWLWIVMDVISIVMYLLKGLYPTTGLYLVYLTVCFIGYWQWRKAIKTPPSALRESHILSLAK